MAYSQHVVNVPYAPASLCPPNASSRQFNPDSYIPNIYALPVYPPDGPSPHARGVGCWRKDPMGKRRPGLVKAIAAVFKAYAGQDDDLVRLAEALLPRLPGQPLASNSLKTDNPRSANIPMERVILSYPWIGMNTPYAINVIWVESDREDWLDCLALAMDAGLPEPDWICAGEVGGHIGYILRTPVVIRHGYSSKKMLKFAKATHEHLCWAINGDRMAALRGMTKNPWSGMWTTAVTREIRAHNLSDILTPLKVMAKAADVKVPKIGMNIKRREADEPAGRNCTVFYGVLRWACDNAVKDGACILAEAMRLNAEFSLPMGHGEVSGIARSLYRFMNFMWKGRKALPVLLSVQERATRQAEGGRLTSQASRRRRSEMLDMAVQELLAQGARVTQVAVAAVSGRCLRTVAGVWTEVRAMVSRATVVTDTRSLSTATGNMQPAPSLSGSSILSATEAPTDPARVSLVSLVSSVSSIPAIPSPVPAPAMPACAMPAPVGNKALAGFVSAGGAVLTGWMYRDGGAAPVRHRLLKSSIAVLSAIQAGCGPRLLPACVYPVLPNPAVLSKSIPLFDFTKEGRERHARARSLHRRHDRRYVHHLASREGLPAYRAWMADRHARLVSERSEAVSRLLAMSTCAHADEMDANTILYHERRKRLHMGWSAIMKAEERIYDIWNKVLMEMEGRIRMPAVPTLPPKPKPVPWIAMDNTARAHVKKVLRFRTTRDAIDLMAEAMDL